MLYRLFTPMYTQQLLAPENIQWLSVSNKYIENQWVSNENWGQHEIERRGDFDQNFIDEFDFVVKETSKL